MCGVPAQPLTFEGTQWSKCEGSGCLSMSVCVCQYGSYEDCMHGVRAQPLTFEGMQWSKCEGNGCLSMSVCVCQCGSLKYDNAANF